jgi:hypothetical protein
VRPFASDLRNTFATRLAASVQPMRAIQDFLRLADSKTTQIYAHYAPSEHEVEMVNKAFAAQGPDAGTAQASEREAFEPESTTDPPSTSDQVGRLSLRASTGASV